MRAGGCFKSAQSRPGEKKPDKTRRGKLCRSRGGGGSRSSLPDMLWVPAALLALSHLSWVPSAAGHPLGVTPGPSQKTLGDAPANWTTAVPRLLSPLASTAGAREGEGPGPTEHPEISTTLPRQPSHPEVPPSSGGATRVGVTTETPSSSKGTRLALELQTKRGVFVCVCVGKGRGGGVALAVGGIRCHLFRGAGGREENLANPGTGRPTKQLR